MIVSRGVAAEGSPGSPRLGVTAVLSSSRDSSSLLVAHHMFLSLGTARSLTRAADPPVHTAWRWNPTPGSPPSTPNAATATEGNLCAKAGSNQHHLTTTHHSQSPLPPELTHFPFTISCILQTHHHHRCLKSSLLPARHHHKNRPSPHAVATFVVLNCHNTIDTM
ncbi:hypothetical protein E2C01_083415 [Portunus trituberculatus]|uniref:Uncharacterized protein n=1 Tax=Portunus trituberculatus TaxID=210409 RepID=A0A5B7J1P7_PORTR|nr:hypothetical protein [Portunus trituberculatus]